MEEERVARRKGMPGQRWWKRVRQVEEGSGAIERGGELRDMKSFVLDHNKRMSEMS